MADGQRFDLRWPIAPLALLALERACFQYGDAKTKTAIKDNLWFMTLSKMLVPRAAPPQSGSCRTAAG
jgi:hypothetical protein